jgi:hypothetical protein
MIDQKDTARIDVIDDNLGIDSAKSMVLLSVAFIEQPGKAACAIGAGDRWSSRGFPSYRRQAGRELSWPRPHRHQWTRPAAPHRHIDV